MKGIVKVGDVREFKKVVSREDVAAFESGVVHEVYSTFSLGRDAEWCCRLFVLDEKEPDEEGIGTFLDVEHCSPALLGSEVVFKAVLENVNGNSLICSYEAKVDDRVVAKGRQGQKIILKTKLEDLFNRIR